LNDNFYKQKCAVYVLKCPWGIASREGTLYFSMVLHPNNRQSEGEIDLKLKPARIKLLLLSMLVKRRFIFLQK
jgi:hypothetical protein